MACAETFQEKAQRTSDSTKPEALCFSDHDVAGRLSSADQKSIMSSMRSGCDLKQLGFHEARIDVTADCSEEKATKPTVPRRDHHISTDDAIKPLAVPLEPYLSSAKVTSADVEDGRTKLRLPDGKFQYQPGILQFDKREDLEEFQNWLNQKIPPDGKPQTDDRRTALILKIAMADASRISDSPTGQATIAYQKLNAMRHQMETLMPEKRYHLDSGLANAEHFLETAHRVGGKPFDGNADDPAGAIWRGKWSADYWKVTSGVYNELKQLGVISGSNAANQHKWELSGIEYGKQLYDATAKQSAEHK